MLASWAVFTGEPHACEDGEWVNKSASSRFTISLDQEEKMVTINDDGVARPGFTEPREAG